jgi:hypothetical protein
MRSTDALAAERIAAHNVALRCFLLRLLDPDDLGFAVTQEVRLLAHELIHMPRVNQARLTQVGFQK